MSLTKGALNNSLENQRVGTNLDRPPCPPEHLSILFITIFPTFIDFPLLRPTPRVLGIPAASRAEKSRETACLVCAALIRALPIEASSATKTVPQNVPQICAPGGRIPALQLMRTVIDDGRHRTVKPADTYVIRRNELRPWRAAFGGRLRRACHCA